MCAGRVAAAWRGTTALHCLDALDQQVGVGVVPLVGCEPLVDVVEEDLLAVGTELAPMLIKHGGIHPADEPAVAAGVKDTPLT